jgi:iron complex outermembrane recepter protein
MKKSVLFVMSALLPILVSPALAQRTDDNVVTQSDDAFGQTVGDEQIGIYNAGDVRGFSPIAAGNVRIEGLFFDQQSGLTDRLIDGSTIRVGISAQGYPFPAPTGIVDYSLRRPGAKNLVSVALNYGPFGGRSGEFDAQLPLDGERLGIAAGAGYFDEVSPFRNSSKVYAVGALGRYKPREGVEIIPFWSFIDIKDEESQSLIFTNGPFLPKRVRRDIFLGQKFSDFGGAVYNYGLVAKADPFGLDIRLGVFRSALEIREDHIDLLFDTDRAGRVGSRQVVVDADNKFASTSGELRIAKTLKDGPRRHTLIASLRARDQARRFGGSAIVDLGVSQIGVQDFRDEPVSVIGPKTRDSVEQVTAGIGYQGRWAKVGELSLGVQKTDYRKETIDPDPTVIFPVTRSRPLLISANAAAYLSDRIVVYGGYTRGLEESPVAPFEAVNRNEAPPAIRTEQKDAGVRAKIGKGVTAVVGLFDVSKPFFNLDETSLFRQLGMVRNRGIEFSLAGAIAPGLSLVVGNVLLDAEVSGEEVERGALGKKPVGTFVRNTNINMDYQVPGLDGLSLNAAFIATSDRTANAANTLVVPARAIVNLGARYKFKIDKTPALVRFNVSNVTNRFGFNVSRSGAFTPNAPRRYALTLAADI